MLSVIIPVFNEEGRIGNLLKYLTSHSSDIAHLEIIVVDGGSTDRTFEEAREYAAAQKYTRIRIIKSAKGRAKQMNYGAAVAEGNILYFLHADSYPPLHFDSYINKEVQDGNPAGCFKMRFDSKHWWVRLLSWFTKFNWRACRGGDQSQFITKGLFEEIGGYDEDYIIYEDNILINALYEKKKFVVIPQPLTSSARLYEEKGVWYVQFHFLKIYIKRWQGADAEELYQYYNDHIRERLQIPAKKHTKTAKALTE
ncbi:MAG: TIGR04283 family arsenosugar biosynthesis glycosyltransferase [Leeuwenhoekiella sp.]